MTANTKDTMPTRTKRSIEMQGCAAQLHVFLLNLEKSYDLTIAEMCHLLGKSLERFVGPVVRDEWETRESRDGKDD